jgi:aryl-alcohol dehydrogenase-like predicted oxidoreductase
VRRADIRHACEASLRRLDTDYVDLYLFHLRDYDLARAGEVRDTLEDLVGEGKIRYYGWSTDDLARTRRPAVWPIAARRTPTRPGRIRCPDTGR